MACNMVTVKCKSNAHLDNRVFNSVSNKGRVVQWELSHKLGGHYKAERHLEWDLNKLEQDLELFSNTIFLTSTSSNINKNSNNSNSNRLFKCNICLISLKLGNLDKVRLPRASR